MRLFKYTVHTYVPDSENQMNYNTKGEIIIQTDSLSEKEIKSIIVRELFKSNPNCTVEKLKQIPQF